jgi:hypothetical protein
MSHGAGLKTCSKCGESKRHDCFYSKGQKLDSRCKICQKDNKKRIRLDSKPVELTTIECSLSIETPGDWSTSLFKLLKESGFLKIKQKEDDVIEKLLNRKNTVNAMLSLDTEG